MFPDNTGVILRGMGRRTTKLVFLATLTGLIPASATAQTPSDDLREGVAALEAKDYRRGLRLLERADAAGEDPRASYYLAYAMEKTGACQTARTQYRDAAIREDVPQPLRVAAVDALMELELRCPSSSENEASAPGESPRTKRERSPVGWQIAGWTSTIVGSLVLLFIPLKSSAERGTAKPTEEYFLTRYGCTVEFGNVEPGCDESGLKEDTVFRTYNEQVRSARRSTRVAWIAGGTLATAGIITLVTIAATSPGRPTPSAFITPEGDVGASVTWRF